LKCYGNCRTSRGFRKKETNNDGVDNNVLSELFDRLVAFLQQSLRCLFYRVKLLFKIENRRLTFEDKRYFRKSGSRSYLRNTARATFSRVKRKTSARTVPSPTPVGKQINIPERAARMRVYAITFWTEIKRNANV